MNTGTYIITSKVGTRKLHACTSGTASNGLNVIIKTANYSPDQMWYFNGSRLKSGSNRDYCLARDSSATYKDNANIYKAQSTQNTNQVVDIVATTDGYYHIILRNKIDGETLYLTVVNNADGSNNGKSASSFGNVLWDTARGSNNQKWAFERVSDPSGAVNINGIKVPFAEFPPDGNTYWTTTGNPTNSAGTDSKQYNGAQCAGFARYVYAQLWGSDEAGSRYGTTISTNGSISNFSGLPLGTRLICTVRQSFNPNDEKFDEIRTDPHHMIIIKKTTSSLTVYHANWDEQCGVAVDTWTGDDLYKRFKEIKSTTFVPN